MLGLQPEQAVPAHPSAVGTNGGGLQIADPAEQAEVPPFRKVLRSLRGDNNYQAIEVDCPPLHGHDDTDDDVSTPAKRDASRSTQSNPVTQKQCKNKCSNPSSLVCAKTGALHPTEDVCSFCTKVFNDEEPFCSVKVGHVHQKPIDLSVVSSCVSPSETVPTSY